MPISAIEQYCLELRPDDHLAAYVEANLRVWADCGLLGDVIDSGARTRFENRELLATHKRLFEQYGPLTRLSRPNNFVEVRIVLLIAYEFAIALYPLIPQRIKDQVTDIYDAAFARCNHSFNDAEFLWKDEDIHARHFISGHARRSSVEFFAECIAAYSVEKSRAALLEIHPDMHALIQKLTEGSLR
jgi:hypothetical protein